MSKSRRLARWVIVDNACNWPPPYQPGWRETAKKHKEHTIYMGDSWKEAYAWARMCEERIRKAESSYLTVFSQERHDVRNPGWMHLDEFFGLVMELRRKETRGEQDPEGVGAEGAPEEPR